MLTAAIISYMGVFPLAYRDISMQSWKHYLTSNSIDYSGNFSLQYLLSDPITVSRWTSQEKLPNDSFSIDNAIILKRSPRWPLMVDPQMQGNNWVKAMEAARNLITLKPTQPFNEISYQLENAISLGYPVLLENITEQIDQLFEPVLA